MVTNIRTSHKGIWSVDLARYVPFSVFESESASRGYKAKDRRPDRNITHNGFTIKSNNGVDCEIKVKMFGQTPMVTYVTGFRGSKDHTDILGQHLISKGYDIIHRNDNYLFINLSSNILDGFWELVDCVENINQILRNPGGSRTIIPIQPQNFAMAVAETIRIAHHYGMPDLLGRGADIFDNIHVKRLRTKGYSVAGQQQLITKNPYCEHITPCDWMLRTGISMCNNGSATKDIADMIDRNFWVAYIADHEADLLNNHFKWKTTMPPNWKDGDNVLDRLTKAGIVMA
jgi:hypothetical protein